MASMQGLPAQNTPPIFTGVWTNWSRGKVSGSILTLTQRDGALLTAFVALFVAYASSLLWRVICLGLHQALSSRGKPRRGLYHQRQVTLRNSSSPLAACYRLLNIAWTWRRQRPRLLRKLLPLTFFCLAYWALLAAASVFSSKISNIVGDEVLISSPYCGRNGMDGDFDPAEPLLPASSGPASVRRLISHDYARSCYSASYRGASCNTFVKERLNFTMSTNTTCPFDPTICKSNSDNVRIDARVNTHDDLGINAPREESLDLLWTSQCAPLKTDRFKTYSDNRSTFATYNYGRSSALNQRNETFKVKRRNVTEYLQQHNLVQTGYTLHYNSYSQRENGSKSKDTDFMPIDELEVRDANINLLSLTGDFVLYASMVDDPWYSAHTPLMQQRIANKNVTFYMSDEEASTLGCRTQIQICSPNGTCTEPENLVNAYDKRTSQDTAQSKLLLHLFQIFAAHSIIDIPKWQKADSLQLGPGGQITGSRGPDQWKRDVYFWSSQFLATLQGSMVDGAVGTSADASTNSGQWILANMSDPTAAKFCRNQKIRSASYTNFSVLWLSIIFSIGGLIMILEWSLESILTCVERRQKGHNYALAEWQTQDVLQLQRLAHEELGLGQWRRGAEAVPLSEGNAKLAVIDLRDREHPRLKAPTVNSVATPATTYQTKAPAVNVASVSATSLGPPASHTSADGAATPLLHRVERN